MRRNQHRRPFYRRPWLWIGLVAILIGIGGGGLLISNSGQHESVQEETKKKAKGDHKSKKKSGKKAQHQAKTSSESQMDTATSASQSQQHAADTGNKQAATVTGSKQHEAWVDPDNYEPNSVVGDRSTMRCYLPGQSPYPAIAQENLVYFDSLAEAQAAGYSTVQ